MRPRILIVDDDERLSEMLSEYLTARGFDVRARHTLGDGLKEALSGDCDAVILDVMLPDGDGLDACREIRSRSDVAVLMLTARGDADDRIVGLELGADDYLGKPFNPRELLARLKAVLRRRASPEQAAGPTSDDERDVIRIGPLEIDRDAREVRVAGEVRELTSHQFALLEVLVSRRGRVQSRRQLMLATTGAELDAFDRSIDVHVSRIRAAIEPDPKKPRYLKTVRSTGYVFVTRTDLDDEVAQEQ